MSLWKNVQWLQRAEIAAIYSLDIMSYIDATINLYPHS